MNHDRLINLTLSRGRSGRRSGRPVPYSKPNLRKCRAPRINPSPAWPHSLRRPEWKRTERWRRPEPKAVPLDQLWHQNFADPDGDHPRQAHQTPLWRRPDPGAACGRYVCPSESTSCTSLLPESVVPQHDRRQAEHQNAVYALEQEIIRQILR